MDILIVEDDELQRRRMYDLLKKKDHSVRACDSLTDARDRIKQDSYDLVLLDMRLPDGDGLAFLTEMKTAGHTGHVVIVTAYADVPSAVEAIRAGAYDYLPKPYETEQLDKIIRNVDENRRMRQRVEGLSRLSGGLVDDVWRLDKMIGCAGMRDLFAKAQRLAEFPDTTVLLLGESGTGKGMMAAAIHRLGGRAEQPFVDVNCSAIPGPLMESEIFGYEKGAFTDAKSSKPGLLEIADGGTVFLDEIGDMEAALQGKLLKVIEDKQFRRLGGSRIVSVNVRIMAATCRDLEAMVADGRFRDDLFYRLSVFPMTMPPLREHPESIAPLASDCLEEFSRTMGRTLEGFTPAAMQAMSAYAWPGNVRELRNTIERSVILCSGGLIDVQDLGLPSPVAAPAHPAPDGDIQPMSLAECERRLIARVLRDADGHRGQAADVLQIHRSTLYKKIADYGL